MAARGRVRRWPYATAGRGAPNYYRLSPLGHQLLHGQGAPPPRRHVGPVGIAHQHHTRCLADFVVHTAVSAHRAGIVLGGFYAENALRLAVGEESLYPDCAFQLVTPAGREFSFFVELDNGTERVRSEKDLDSWERKVRLYDTLRSGSARRFRVLVVATRSEQRLRRILAAAAEHAANPARSLVYGVLLPSYLAEPDGLTSPCYRDHRGHAVALIPHDGTEHAGIGEPRASHFVAGDGSATVPGQP